MKRLFHACYLMDGTPRFSPPLTGTLSTAREKCGRLLIRQQLPVGSDTRGQLCSQHAHSPPCSLPRCCVKVTWCQWWWSNENKGYFLFLMKIYKWQNVSCTTEFLQMLSMEHLHQSHVKNPNYGTPSSQEKTLMFQQTSCVFLVTLQFGGHCFK